MTSKVNCSSKAKPADTTLPLLYISWHSQAPCPSHSHFLLLTLIHLTIGNFPISTRPFLAHLTPANLTISPLPPFCAVLIRSNGKASCGSLTSTLLLLKITSAPIYFCHSTSSSTDISSNDPTGGLSLHIDHFIPELSSSSSSLVQTSSLTRSFSLPHSHSLG